MQKKQETNYAECPVEGTLALIQGKWKVVILLRLKDATRRFNELMRLLPNITQRTLTNQLRELERDGLVSRTIYAEVPPKVEYSLTELGVSIMPVLLSIKAWGKDNLQASEGGGDSDK